MLWERRLLLREQCWVVALWEPAIVACYSVTLLLVSSSVFVSSAIIQCSIKLNVKLNSLGASHSAPGAVRVVALWGPATVACFSVALLLVSSSVFISSAVIQCSVEPRGPDAGCGPGGLDALGASHSAPGAVRVGGQTLGVAPGGWTLWVRRILLREQ
jgi:hypothetical protein